MVKCRWVLLLLVFCVSRNGSAQEISTARPFYLGVNMTDYALYDNNLQFMYRFKNHWAGVLYMAGGLRDGGDRRETTVQDLRFEMGPRWIVPGGEGLFLQATGVYVYSKFWYVSEAWRIATGADGLQYYQHYLENYSQNVNQFGGSLTAGFNFTFFEYGFFEFAGSYGYRWSSLDPDHEYYEAYDGLSYSGYSGLSIRMVATVGVRF